MKKTVLLMIVCMALVAGCNDDSYKTGDGDFSLLIIETVDLHTSMATRVDYATTDNNTTLTLRPHMEVAWATKADTIYRGLLYYFRKEGTTDVDPYQLAPVTVLRPVAKEKISKMQNDPVGFTSAAITENGRYINLILDIKTASNTGSDNRQQIGLVENKIEEQEDGHKTYFYTLFHAQNGVPENYTSKVYFSIPIDKVAAGDKVHLTLNSYNGVVECDFVQR